MTNKTRNKILKKIHSKINKNITATIKNKSIVLNGIVNNAQKRAEAGFIAANKGFKGVINNIKIKGEEINPISEPIITDNKLENMEYDITIIGAGIIGSSIARELSKYDLKIALLEKENDVAKHQSSRNDGMIHPGFAPHVGSKKAYYNAKGNKLYTQITKELDVDFKRPGEIIIFDSPIFKLFKPILLKRAKSNGIKDIKILSKKQVLEMEPNITRDFAGGIYLPSAGVLSPYKMTIAYTENAIINGVDLHLNTIVKDFEKGIRNKNISIIKTNRGNFKSKLIINAAGLWSDYIAKLADDQFFSIHPRKGIDMILDMNTKFLQNHIIGELKFSSLFSKTKGGGIITTVEGNLLIGPTAIETAQKEDYSTNKNEFGKLFEKFKLNTKIKPSDVISYFAGNRACTYEEDFVIEYSENVDNLIHVAGIQSPGLASAPAISLDVAKMAIDKLKLNQSVELNKYFNPIRKSKPHLAEMDFEKRSELIKKNPDYGKIVCRCEGISEGEIKDALESPIPITTLDQIKRRTRAQTGRCQGGFCTPRILEIISKKKNIPINKITKKFGNSKVLNGETKINIDYSHSKTRLDVE